MLDWIEREYRRLKLEEFNKDNEIVIINGDKLIKRKDLTNFYEEEDLKMEEKLPPFNVGKDFHNDWNKEDNYE